MGESDWKVDRESGFATGEWHDTIPGNGTKRHQSRKMAEHPNKHIRAALKYAEQRGWTVRKSGPRAHAWGVIYCQYGHGNCWMAIYSTPSKPEAHARDIRRTVDRCPGP